MKEILSEVLAEIKPKKEDEEQVLAKISLILNAINKGLKDAKAILGGSGVKGTWLRDANDADIFVKFNYNKYKSSSAEISGMLEKWLKRRFPKIEKIHGSRDYFQIKEKSFTYEIVPILNIKKASQAMNITDVSPLHADWVNKKGKSLKDEIRLLKQFCKANRIYGAESHINGFSGYVCEILVIRFKGFLPLVKKAASWKEKEVIDVESHWKGKNILMELNKSKTSSPLVVIDPVQAGRNAAAAISREKFGAFKEACRNFLKKPSKEFFAIKETTAEQLKKKAGKNCLITMKISPKSGKRDVVGCKIIKALEHIKKTLLKNDFKVIESSFALEKEASAYFIIKKQKLSSLKESIGPPVDAKTHVENFKKSHKKTIIRGNRIIGLDKRKYTDPKKIVEGMKNDTYIKEKILGFELK